MSRLLDQLNPQQREAVEHTEGPALILAGAGSGKTRAITYRIAYLIGEKGVAPESILAVTFTNKAADQMKERVAALLSETLETWPHISTFHSFCVRVLRRSIDKLGYTRAFSIYDEDDQARVVKTVVSELGLSDQVTSPRSGSVKLWLYFGFILCLPIRPVLRSSVERALAIALPSVVPAFLIAAASIWTDS